MSVERIELGERVEQALEYENHPFRPVRSVSVVGRACAAEFDAYMQKTMALVDEYDERYSPIDPIDLLGWEAEMLEGGRREADLL